MAQPRVQNLSDNVTYRAITISLQDITMLPASIRQRVQIVRYLIKGAASAYNKAEFFFVPG